MSLHQFKTFQFLPISNKRAWDFFSSAKNLSVITPPEMDFNILTQNLPEEIYEGMKIDYTVKPLLGIKMKWQTEISKVDQNFSFTDRQLIGPYKTWIHTHTFYPQKGGILMKDVVDYELPLGNLGNIMHWLIVRNKIENIFVFRKLALEKLFKNDID